MATQWSYGFETKSRSRTLDGPSYCGYVAETKVPGQPVQVVNYPFKFECVGGQTTTSKDNGFFLARKQLRLIKQGKLKVPPYARKNLEQGDFGSAFETVTNEYELISPTYYPVAQAGYTTYRGNVYFAATGSGVIPRSSSYFPRVTPPTNDYLFQLGGTAISRCIPTNPSADLATFLGELREGLPSMVGLNALKNIRRPGKAGGGEYLNYQFGIKPMVSDVRKLVQATQKSSVILKQFERDSGRLIRRSYHFPKTEVEEDPVIVGTGRGLYPSLPTYMYASFNSSDFTGTLTRQRKTTIESWFSGGFTYFVDLDSDALSRIHRKAQELRRVYGADLNLEVAWNLAPWSWAADWFANTGDVIHNLTAFSRDGLVMRYGYLMYKETIQDTYTHTGVNLKSGPTGPVSQVFRTVYKRRVKAHPYGFGLTEESLSPRQLAILAALGISRGRAD